MRLGAGRPAVRASRGALLQRVAQAARGAEHRAHQRVHHREVRHRGLHRGQLRRGGRGGSPRRRGLLAGTPRRRRLGGALGPRRVLPAAAARARRRTAAARAPATGAGRLRLGLVRIRLQALALGPRRRHVLARAELLDLEEVLLRVRADLDDRLGAHVRLDHLPLAVVELERLDELGVLGVRPGLALLGDRIRLPDFLRAVREARDVCRAAAPAALRVHLLGTRLGASACPRAALGAFLRAAAAAAPLGRHGGARRATGRGAGGSEGSPGASSSVLAGVLSSAPVGARPRGRPPPYGAPRSGAR
mmetsp:Transcript_9818/g.40509  ORF Transcript_9818/g.40509 Transcript_9818/m.40509 type:complete len:305 (-) Transcript_9818:114-1028(-)